MSDIKPIVMPKWGLAMQEGTLAKWAVEEGQTIKAGQEIMDIETSKIANVFESPVEGTLRRRVARDGDVLPVGALLGVVADPGTPEAAIEAYVAEFLAKFESAAKEEVKAPEPTIVEIGGKRMRYLKLGPDEGTPVVFVHGFGSDHASWLFNHTAAAETHPAYAVDLPGHGGSTKDVGDGSAATLAASVTALIDHLGLKRVHLVGHSLGGAVAALVAAANPGRVASLALIAPLGLGKTVNGPFLDGILEEVRGKKLRPWLEMLVANPDLITSEMIEDVLKFKRLDGVVPALTAIRNANMPGSESKVAILPALAALKCPILAIAGADDQIIPAAELDLLPAGVEKHVIAHSGHIPQMEHANEVNALLAKLWR